MRAPTCNRKLPARRGFLPKRVELRLNVDTLLPRDPGRQLLLGSRVMVTYAAQVVCVSGYLALDSLIRNLSRGVQVPSGCGHGYEPDASPLH